VTIDYIGLILLLCDVIISVFLVSIALNSRKITSNLLFGLVLYVFMILKTLYINYNAKDSSALFLTIYPILIIMILCMIFHHTSWTMAVVVTMFYVFYSVLIQAIALSIGYGFVKIYEMISGRVTDKILFENSSQIFYMILALLVLWAFKIKILNTMNIISSYFTENKKKYIKVIKIVITAIIVVCMLCAGIDLFVNSTSLNEKMITITILTFAILIIVIISYYESVASNQRAQKLETRMKFAEEKARLIEENLRTERVYHEFVDTMNQFGHSYNNMLQTISVFINNDEVNIEELRSALSDILEWNETFRISHKMKYINIPNMIVASVLSLKLEKAEKLGVILDVAHDGDFPVKINSKDFIDIINILLDNAIEAAYHTTLRDVEVHILFAKDKFILSVLNGFTLDQNGEILKYGDSKKIGLQTIEDIVNNTPGMSFITNKGTTRFDAELIMVYQKEVS